MKRLLVLFASCVAMNTWAQADANSEWESVGQSSEVQYFYKKGSGTTFVKSNKSITTGLFSRAQKGTQTMVVVSIHHRECVAGHGTYNVTKLSDKSFSYDPEFALGRPIVSLADTIASHLCKIAWDYQISDLVTKSKSEIDYAGSVEMQRLFDSFLAELNKSSARSGKDIEALLYEAHQMVLGYVGKK